MTRLRPVRTGASARLLTVALAVGLAGGLSGCGGGDEATPGGEDATPEESLALAKETLDETTGVRITLEASELSSAVKGIRKASGVGIHPAAFEGTFDLSVTGIPATAEVIAVDGTVFAKNSLLLPQWTEIDPAEYGAPDPIELMTPDAGFSKLLTETTDVAAGDQERGGTDNSEIFTTFTGTVPSTAVTDIVPTASGDFDAVYTISDEGELREARLKGVFYEDDKPMTYTISFDDYGTEQEITAP